MELSDAYLKLAVDELVDLLGVSPNIRLSDIVHIIEDKGVESGVTEIAKSLQLPIKINLIYIDSMGQNFETKDLVNTDKFGRGHEGIGAQVLIPSYVPMIGSSALVGFPIQIKITKNYVNYLPSFITVMAHELTHIVLHSILYSKKDNEVHTDLAAMVLGYNEVFNAGRKHVVSESKTIGSTTYTNTSTSSYGYLDDHQFNYAYTLIKTVRSKSEKLAKALLKKMRVTDSNVKKNIWQLAVIEKYIKYLTTNKVRIKDRKDSEKVIDMFQLNYINSISERLNKELARINILEKSLKNSKVLKMKNLIALEATLRNMKLDDSTIISNDLETLKKHVKFSYKLKNEYLPRLSRMLHI